MGVGIGFALSSLEIQLSLCEHLMPLTASAREGFTLFICNKANKGLKEHITAVP